MESMLRPEGGGYWHYGTAGSSVAREAADLVLLNDFFNYSALWQMDDGFSIISEGYVLYFSDSFSMLPCSVGTLVWSAAALTNPCGAVGAVIDPTCSIVFEAQGPEAI